MTVLIHDLGEEYNTILKDSADLLIHADGKYVPCKGCFHCWTKNPAKCDFKDALQEICRVIGQSDNRIVITENWYGGHSPAVKNLLDRSIGTSTPLSTLRGGHMHHTLRYGKHNHLKVVVYGNITEREKATWNLMVERNAMNEGFAGHEVVFIASKDELEKVSL